MQPVISLETGAASTPSKARDYAPLQLMPSGMRTNSEQGFANCRLKIVNGARESIAAARQKFR
jgi:hypothetical protein